MDHQLSLFVRKYCFDFAKASKALRSYVQHVSPISAAALDCCPRQNLDKTRHQLTALRGNASEKIAAYALAGIVCADFNARLLGRCSSR